MSYMNDMNGMHDINTIFLLLQYNLLYVANVLAMFWTFWDGLGGGVGVGGMGGGDNGVRSGQAVYRRPFPGQ